MTASLLPPARAVFNDANGNPLSGGYVYTYVPGGTTPATTWQNANETTPNTNPIVLDANGSCLLYGAGQYQLTVTDALNNQVPAYSGLSQDPLSVAEWTAGPVSSLGTGLALSGGVLSSTSEWSAGTVSSIGGLLSLSGDVLAATFNQSPSGNFYENLGATIDRFNDRIFAGNATVNDGNSPSVTKDWLETLIPNTTGISQFGILATEANSAIVAGTRSSDFVSGGPTDSFAISAFGINNLTTSAQLVWSYYGEGRHYPSLPSGAQTLMAEFDIIPLSGVSAGYIDPYNMAPQLVTGNLWLSCGRPDVASADATVAIGILNNAGTSRETSGRYSKGIVFDCFSIEGTDGTTITSSAIAIAFAKGHTIQWFNGASQFTGGISCSASSENTGFLSFFDGGAAITGGDGGPLWVEFGYIASAVNYITLLPGATGSAVEIVAQGSDANIDLILAPKASGVIRLGQGTAAASNPSAFSATHWFVIKDEFGTEWLLPVTASAW